MNKRVINLWSQSEENRHTKGSTFIQYFHLKWKWLFKTQYSGLNWFFWANWQSVYTGFKTWVMAQRFRIIRPYMGQRININNVADDDKQENYGWQQATFFRCGKWTQAVWSVTGMHGEVSPTVGGGSKFILFKNTKLGGGWGENVERWRQHLFSKEQGNIINIQIHFLACQI